MQKLRDAPRQVVQFALTPHPKARRIAVGTSSTTTKAASPTSPIRSATKHGECLHRGDR